jgi:hypothetical protein
MRVRATLVLATLSLACGPADGPDARERMTGGVSVRCSAPGGPGLGYAGGGLIPEVVATYEDDRVQFEGLLMLACPLTGTYEAERYTFPSQDCTDGDFDEYDIHGFGEWRDDVLVLEIDSVEYHSADGNPTSQRYPVPCEHHFELELLEQ